VLPPQMTTMPALSHRYIDVGMVSAPECSSTTRGARRSPRTSQKRRPAPFAPVTATRAEGAGAAQPAFHRLLVVGVRQSPPVAEVAPVDVALGTEVPRTWSRPGVPSGTIRSSSSTTRIANPG
jgi:hypothetical protein